MGVLPFDGEIKMYITSAARVRLQPLPLPQPWSHDVVLDRVSVASFNTTLYISFGLLIAMFINSK